MSKCIARLASFCPQLDICLTRKDVGAKEFGYFILKVGTKSNFSRKLTFRDNKKSMTVVKGGKKLMQR